MGRKNLRFVRSLSENSDKLLGRPRMRAACGVQISEFTSGVCTPQDKKDVATVAVGRFSDSHLVDQNQLADDLAAARHFMGFIGLVH